MCWKVGLSVQPSLGQSNRLTNRSFFGFRNTGITSLHYRRTRDLLGAVPAIASTCTTGLHHGAQLT
jgi:hypothetical protein